MVDEYTLTEEDINTFEKCIDMLDCNDYESNILAKDILLEIFGNYSLYSENSPTFDWVVEECWKWRDNVIKLWISKAIIRGKLYRIK